jgi:hypothetical protein
MEKQGLLNHHNIILSREGESNQKHERAQNLKTGPERIYNKKTTFVAVFRRSGERRGGEGGR